MSLGHIDEHERGALDRPSINVISNSITTREALDRVSLLRESCTHPSHVRMKIIIYALMKTCEATESELSLASETLW